MESVELYHVGGVARISDRQKDGHYYDDCEAYRISLEMDSKRLFSDDQVHVEMLFKRQNRCGIFQHRVNPSFFPKSQTSVQRFCVTSDVFRKILDFHNVFAPFLDNVQAFGRNVQDLDLSFGCYQRRLYENPESGNLQEECCNNEGRTVGLWWLLPDARSIMKISEVAGQRDLLMVYRESNIVDSCVRSTKHLPIGTVRLKQIAFDTNEENHAAQNDAHSMKVLTFIAMLYLPASLVAVSISRPPKHFAADNYRLSSARTSSKLLPLVRGMLEFAIWLRRSSGYSQFSPYR
ncbi:hypothetical protein K440DRAFT_636391 [Wilcoxina mikolae CBS 423.85]|nr:hypothetical protein K440DRAFT_636391 [Wilcoxina mikolae CBS 423.85]